LQLSSAKDNVLDANVLEAAVQKAVRDAEDRFSRERDLIVHKEQEKLQSAIKSAVLLETQSAKNAYDAMSSDLSKVREELSTTRQECRKLREELLLARKSCESRPHQTTP